MKPTKLIIVTVGVIILVGLAGLIWRATDHTREFRDALISHDIEKAEEMLKRHPALATSSHLGFSSGGPSRPQPAGWTALHFAAARGDRDLAELLLRYHANLEARDNRGLTPLLWTAFAGQKDVAAVLLSRGADVNARGLDGRSTIDLAKLSRDENLIQLLRERGAKE